MSKAFLTQEEVNDLPDGVMVEVVWIGASKPSRYRTVRDGSVVRVKPGEHALDYIGVDKTTVRLI
jgi:hypothetical protein